MKKLYFLFALIAIFSIFHHASAATKGTIAFSPITTDLTGEYTLTGGLLDFKISNNAPSGSYSDVTYTLVVRVAKAEPVNGQYQYVTQKGSSASPLRISNSSQTNSVYQSSGILAAGQFSGIADGKYKILVQVISKFARRSDGLSDTTDINKSASSNTITIPEPGVNPITIKTTPKTTSASVAVTYDWKVGPGMDKVDIEVRGPVVAFSAWGGAVYYSKKYDFSPTAASTGKKTFSFDLTDLVKGTKYSVSAIATKSGQKSYEKKVEFTTTGQAPATTTPGTTNPSQTTTTDPTTAGNDPVKNDPPVEVTPQSDSPTTDRTTYKLLAPINGIESIKTENVGGYFNTIFNIIIGICGVLAVVMIVIGGIQYMGNESVFGKTEAKSKIMSAILGLLIALGAYAILNTLNPALTGKDGLSINAATVPITADELGTDMAAERIHTSYLGGDLSSDTQAKLGKMSFPPKVKCPQTGGSAAVREIALSFMGEVTYNNTGKMGMPAPDGKIYMDCSTWANTVLACAGITPKTVNHTSAMKAKGEAISTVEVKNNKGYINGKELNPGDLVGVNNGKGHVWVYIGNGEILDSQVNDRKSGQSVISAEKLAKSLYGGSQVLNFVLRY